MALVANLPGSGIKYTALRNAESIKTRKSQSGEDVLLVTHRGTMRIFPSMMRGIVRGIVEGFGGREWGVGG